MVKKLYTFILKIIIDGGNKKLKLNSKIKISEYKNLLQKNFF